MTSVDGEYICQKCGRDWTLGQTEEAVDPTLRPPLSLLVKVGSLVAHIAEFLSPNGHEFDKAAIRTLLADAEVQTWLKDMDQLGFLPKKR
jgi:hypothetical protein